MFDFIDTINRTYEDQYLVYNDLSGKIDANFVLLNQHTKLINNLDQQMQVMSTMLWVIIALAIILILFCIFTSFKIHKLQKQISNLKGETINGTNDVGSNEGNNSRGELPSSSR